jgi:putative tryptophan/tyrosine transport system substrate-binding protein
MRRREFIAGLGAAAWPVIARAQERERVRRIGVLVGGLAADDPEWQTRGTAFVQGLAQLGWIDGRNVRIDYRFGSGDPERQRRYAAEMVALAPDVILAAGSGGVSALQHATRTVPIVFANVIDPVGAGFVGSLARPAGNTTGFVSQEFGLSGKSLELLKQIAPQAVRVGVLRNPNSTIEVAQFAAIQSAASSLGVELTPIGARDGGAIERDIVAFARAPNSGLIVVSNGVTRTYRDLIIALAARHRLVAVYAFRGFVAEGGLMSYGIDQSEPYRLAAGYVDRVLKGENPGDLPVQLPTKFEMAINLKTANALGLTIPETLLATADEVIQ